MNCRNVDLSCINDTKKNSSSSQKLQKLVVERTKQKHVQCSFNIQKESSHSIECLFIFNFMNETQSSTRSIIRRYFFFVCIELNFFYTKYACIFEIRLLDKLWYVQSFFF